MLPLDESSHRAFVAETQAVRERLLEMVDAYPYAPPIPSVGSRAMADLAAEESLIRDDEWGSDLMATVDLWIAIQMYGVLEGAAGFAQLVGSERVYVLNPYVLIRFVAECAGRARWLCEPSISTQDRVVRSLNLKISDFDYRKQLLERDEMNRRMRGIRDGAKERGLELTPSRTGARFIEPGLPSNTDFAKRGMSGSHGTALSAIASAAIHGALTPSLSHIFYDDSGPDSDLLPQRAGFGTSAHLTNMFLLAVGLALRDSVNAVYAYYGYESREWSESVGRLMRSARDVLKQSESEKPQ